MLLRPKAAVKNRGEGLQKNSRDSTGTGVMRQEILMISRLRTDEIRCGAPDFIRRIAAVFLSLHPLFFHAAPGRSNTWGLVMLWITELKGVTDDEGNDEEI